MSGRMTESQAAFKHICTLWDFSHTTGLVTDALDTDNAYLKHIISDAIKKLGIDAIFFYKPDQGGPCVPLIYFKLMEYPSSSEIAELHKLSWNIGKAPLLFIVLPDTVQVYNNLEPPKIGDSKVGLIDELKIYSQIEEERKALKNYERAEFETGNYWRRNIDIFKTDKGIFRMLLKNLDYMRLSLINSGLSSNIVHLILVRSIFIKYLEDRRDRQNNGVFPNGFFSQFRKGAICFADLLVEKKATYSFFRYLSNKFNGDILVVDKIEEDTIKQEHLILLQRMLRGEEHLAIRQLVLWPLYSFDVIPIELISSIYEQFLTLKSDDKRVVPQGIHYTPYQLVAFLMDEVLPFTDDNYNVKILDPACGSGVFLVESYRRLVARWMKSYPSKQLSALNLVRILRDNIYGVDLDENAIRIAALSLYLSICDYFEPKTIWNEVKFERLVNRNLFISDFFNEDSKFSSEKFDLVIGNPPWASNLTANAERYVKSRHKPIGDLQICQAFLWKSAEICRPDGIVCLIVSSKSLLFNRSQKNLHFRKEFFSTYDIKAIFNFSALRFSLFSHAVGPGAVIIFSPTPPSEGKTIFYCSPKPTFTIQDELSFLIEPQDIANIPLNEALESEYIWKVAMWGLPRDYELIKKLSLLPTLADTSKKLGWIDGEGYKIGNGRYFTNDLKGKLEVSVKDLQSYIININALKRSDKTHFNRWAKTKKEIYKGPHLLIKQSPIAGQGLVSAVMTEDSIFSQSIIGIHSDSSYLSQLIGVCIALNSSLPLYFSILTSGGWLVERDELTKGEIMSIPIPDKVMNENYDMSIIERLGADEEFRRSENDKLLRLYGLDDTEIILVEDTIEFTLDYFRNKGRSTSIEPPDDPDVKKYMEILCNTLNNQFSSLERTFHGTVYLTKGPLRLISLHLKSDDKVRVSEERNEEEMVALLKQLDRELIEEKTGSVYVQRHLRRYSKNSIHIVKPNQKRYWKKSSAFADSDKIYADIMESWRTMGIDN